MPIGKWKETWGSTKDAFKDLTGVKKPSIPKLGGLLKKHKTSVASSLGDADKAYAVYNKALLDFDNDKIEEPKIHDALNAYGRAVKAANKSTSDYQNVIGGEINKHKAVKDIHYRALKTMTKQLDTISSEMDLAQTELFGRFQMLVEKKRREKAKDEKMSAEEMIKISTDPMIKKSLVTNCKKLLVFVSQCKALVKKNPADLTDALKFYNTKIQKTARDTTQPLSNVVKRLKIQLPGNVKTAEGDLVARNGGRFSLAPNTTAPQYVQELKLLSGHAKTIEAWASNNL